MAIVKFAVAITPPNLAKTETYMVLVNFTHILLFIWPMMLFYNNRLILKKNKNYQLLNDEMHIKLSEIYKFDGSYFFKFYFEILFL